MSNIVDLVNYIYITKDHFSKLNYHILMGGHSCTPYITDIYCLIMVNRLISSFLFSFNIYSQQKN